MNMSEGFHKLLISWIFVVVVVVVFFFFFICAIFNWVSRLVELLKVLLYFAPWLVQKSSRHSLNQSYAKLRRRISISLRSRGLFKVYSPPLISDCNYFGSGITTLSQNALYPKCISVTSFFHPFPYCVMFRRVFKYRISSKKCAGAYLKFRLNEGRLQGGGRL